MSELAKAAPPAPEAALGRTFMLVLSGQAVSAFGSGLTAFAVAVWVYQQSQSLLQFGLVMFTNAIATALSAPWLGVACDRYPLRRMMLVGDCGAAVLTALMLWLLLSSQLVLWMLLIAVALDAVLATLHQIAYRSAVPAMVPRQGLARANGMVETGLALSALLAPLAAGSLMGAIGLRGILFVDLATFVIAALTLICARFPSAIEDVANASAPTPAASVRQGWRYLRSNPDLFRLLVVVLAGSFVLAGVQVLFAPMVLAVHGAGMLGALTTVAGFGTFSAGVLISVTGRDASMRALLACQIVLAALLLALAASTSILWLAASAFSVYAASQWGSITARTLWQREVAADMRGRAFALVSTSAALVVPLAQLGVPWVAERVVGPWLQDGGAESELAARILGRGDGAPAAVCIALLGLILLLFAGFARLTPAWSRWRSPAATAPSSEAA